MSRYLTGSFIVESDEVYSSTTGPVFYIEAFGSDIVFENYGTIRANGGSGYTGISSFVSRGTILNAGSILVNADGTGYGLYSPQWCADVTNTGLIDVRAVKAGGHGYGMMTWSPEQGFDNSGRINVVATSFAAGLYFINGADLANTGSIVAQTTNGNAYGVVIERFEGDSFENRGVITATAGGTGVSYGLMTAALESYNGTEVVNYGTITADWAIATSSGGYSPLQLVKDRVYNHGTLNGSVFLGYGDDYLINTGTLRGDIDMSAGNDEVVLDKAITGVVDLGEGDDKATGSAGNDVLLGYLGRDNLSGGSGDDYLEGEQGADILDGGKGADLLVGGTGGDTLTGGEGNDILWGDSGADTIDGGAGNDIAMYDSNRAAYRLSRSGDQLIITGADGFSDTLTSVEWLDFGGVRVLAANVLITNTVGTAGRDDLIGSDAADQISAGAGDDAISGGLGSDTIDGGEGRDTAFFFGSRSDYTVSWAAGVATVVGPDGSDTLTNIERLQFGDVTVLTGPTGGQVLSGTSGVDRVEGSTLDDEITGGAGNDELLGLAGDDLLYGDAGDDVLHGGAGSDLIDGGTGRDILTLETGAIGYRITTEAGVTTIVSANGTDRVTNVEALRFSFIDLTIGTSPIIIGWNQNGTETIEGTAGNDRIYSLDGSDTVNAGDGADYLEGYYGDDRLNGEAGDDVLYGGVGMDVLNGGSGTDTADYTRSSRGVTVRLDLGTAPGDGEATTSDTLISIENVTGSYLADLIVGDVGANVLSGGVGQDTLRGMGGNDVLLGGAGVSNTLEGGDGDDTYFVEVATDVITELVGAGSDSVMTALSTFNLAVNLENLTYTGFAAFNGTGNGLSNVIIGGVQSDVLRGEGGDDILNGGIGALNDLRGGQGNDRYILSLQDLVLESADEGVDTIETSALASYTLGQHIENLIYVGSASFTGVGNGLDNNLTGGSNADALTGLAGDDRLTGGTGNDTLDGGEGDDMAVFSGPRSAYVITLVDSVTTVTGADGVDVLRNVEWLRFADARTDPAGVTVIEAIVGTPGPDILQGAGDDDVVSGQDGDDTLSGQAGDDRLSGGAGTDSLDGGADQDTADYGSAAAGVTASLALGTASNDGDGGTDALTGIENLIGSAFNDSLTGDADANVLAGSGGNDTLLGGDGDDLLRGGAGVDVLTGGAGVDTADYSTAIASMRAQLNSNASTNDGDGGTDTFSSIENLIGSAFADVLIGDGAANVLRGGLGADTLLGLAGNDVLWGGTGAVNQLQGGAGDDRYVLEANDSVVEVAGEGNDTIEVRIGAYVLAANVEILIFTGAGAFAGTGNAQANSITGGDGNDNLRGRGGVDALHGGAGIDTVDYTLAAAGVTARLDLMRATNDGDGATDTFSGVENLTGSNFNDTLFGDAGVNVIQGGNGSDVILGFGGDDVLMGGSGGVNNQLQGGAGNDRYILDAFDTVFELAGEGIDTVEARIGSYTLGNNVENLLYTGPGKFVGNGNAMDNVITGGSQDDILRGKGGADTIDGGLGRDEVQLRGVAANYTVTAEGAGWRIVDNVAGRDGSTFVTSIEVLRFANNATRVLTYPPVAAALEPTGKDGAQVSPLMDDDAFVLPALGDEPLVLPGLEADKGGDLPMVLPALDDLFEGLEARLAFTGDWMATLGETGGLIDPAVQRHGDWMG